jgi:hypothetical protein
MREKIKKILKPKIKLVPGTRLTSFLFIALSVIIAAGILIAANMYYNIDTGEVIIEQINRVTQLIRATGGLIVGGGATQNPDTGYDFQVVGQSKLATTTLEGYLEAINSSEAPLRFATTSGGYYIGFKAPTGLTANTIYTWPTSTSAAANRVLAAYDTAGTLYWMDLGAAGLGTVREVGDCPDGSTRCFVSATGTSYGNTLWFHPNATFTMALTAADGSLTANATTIIPAVSGTNYLTLTPSALTSGRVLLATGNYTIGDNANLAFDTANNILTIGSSGSSGELRIYDGTYYLAFAPTSTMTQNTTYYWPPSLGAANQVLTTDGAGNLTWSTVQGVGGITGSGSATQVAFFEGTQSITGSDNFIWSTTTNTLTISGTVIATTFRGPDTATTTITSASGYNILLDPATGKVYLGSSDYIITAQGYEIGKTGKQILREMIPIMGFDLPVQTATTGWAQVSRVMDSCNATTSFPGTTRVWKLVIRYTDDLPTASTTSWRVSTTTGAAYDTFTLPGSNDANLDSGQTRIVEVNVPCDTYPWWLEVSTPDTASTIRIFQIFLAAYDQIL